MFAATHLYAINNERRNYAMSDKQGQGFCCARLYRIRPDWKKLDIGCQR